MLLVSDISPSYIHLHETRRSIGWKKLAHELACNVLATIKDPVLLLCIGGDGTLQEVINGSSQASIVTKLQLGIVPSGTGNAFATALGITDPADAISSVFRGHL